MTSPDTQDLARAVRDYLAALTETTEPPWDDAQDSSEKETGQ